MREPFFGEPSEFCHKRGGLLRCEIAPEHFHGDEAVAGGFVGTKHRTERARADLMENPERPECLWRKVQDRIFVVQ